MRLGGVDEMSAIGGDIEDVVIRRIGETNVTFSIEADAMKLQLHRIVAAARGVVEEAGGG